jgi:hypothetical protein
MHRAATEDGAFGQRQGTRPDVLMKKLTDESVAVQMTIRDSTSSPAKGTPMQPEEDKSGRGIHQG